MPALRNLKEYHLKAIDSKLARGITLLEKPTLAQREKLFLVSTKRDTVRSLREILANAQHYELGPHQIEILKSLITSARKARTRDEVERILSKTCGLRVKKH
ncbi:MAG: hypothetical protein WCW44_02795 [archaeon]|jgi:hypothetical protein